MFDPSIHRSAYWRQATTSTSVTAYTILPVVARYIPVIVARCIPPKVGRCIPLVAARCIPAGLCGAVATLLQGSNPQEETHTPAATRPCGASSAASIHPCRMSSCVCTPCRARRCRWTLAPLASSTIRRRVACARPTSSSPPSASAATSMPSSSSTRKRPPGSAYTAAPSRVLAAYPSAWCRTTSSPR